MPEVLQKGRVPWERHAAPSMALALQNLRVIDGELQEVQAGPSAIQTLPDLTMVAGRIQEISENVDTLVQISDAVGSIVPSLH